MIVIIAVLLACLGVGCAGGIPQEQYDRLGAQLRNSQAQVSELQGEIKELEKQNEAVEAELKASQAQASELQSQIKELEKQNEAVDAELKTSQAQIAALQGQIGDLEEHYELVGKTPADTAENIVRRYHETHVYSEYDYYVCGDMSADVWNMLKAQGIGALIQVGNTKTGVSDLSQSDHAWVLAEVSPGQYLALETTAGYVVAESQNNLYYKGWSFRNPKDFKSYQELLREYNVRVDMINQILDKAKAVDKEFEEEYDYYKELVDEFNSKYAGRPVSTESQIAEVKIEAQLALVDEKEASYNQLNELVDEQKKKMESIKSEMGGLATERY